MENLKYYNQLFKEIPKEQIKWKCYFTGYPENSTIVSTNRAGYAVFMEIPIGNGKVVMLPRFENMVQATTILLNNVLPQMVHEEESILAPAWLENFSSPFEQQVLKSLGQIEKGKRLLYTYDKTLKKAVAFAFEQLGFSVKILPDGTNADIIISDGTRKAVCEVKGHKNRQSARDDLVQLLGYVSDEENNKGIFVSNHEFFKEPDKRSLEAFTLGAIDLGKKNDFSLLSTVDLYRVTEMILRKELKQEDAEKIRHKIMTGSGIVRFP